jgi:outer membrane protein assembly factor BamD
MFLRIVMALRPVLWPTLCLALVSACSSAPSGAAVYAVTAQQNYSKGLNELEQKDWVAAAKYFAFIRARFPYSKYAVLAELRISDAEFGASHYVQAIDGYKLFIKFHPTHEMVTNGYAEFRIGEAYYKMLPGDMWILPPAYEKDQSSTYDAERELRTFVKKHPSSQYTERAKKMLQRVHAHLAAHEWYVARFYWERDKPMGTVLRLRRLLDRFAGTRYDGDALWLLGQAYLKVKMPERAKDVWQRLINEHPNHAQAGAARRALADLSS